MTYSIPLSQLEIVQYEVEYTYRVTEEDENGDCEYERTWIQILMDGSSTSVTDISNGILYEYESDLITKCIGESPTDIERVVFGYEIDDNYISTHFKENYLFERLGEFEIKDGHIYFTDLSGWGTLIPGYSDWEDGEYETITDWCEDYSIDLKTH